MKELTDKQMKNMEQLFDSMPLGKFLTKIEKNRFTIKERQYMSQYAIGKPLPKWLTKESK